MMTCPAQPRHGIWILFGPAIEQKRDEIKEKIYPASKDTKPKYDKYDWFLYRILHMGAFHGNQGFNLDRLRVSLIGMDTDGEAKISEAALNEAVTLFSQSQDSMP